MTDELLAAVQSVRLAAREADARIRNGDIDRAKTELADAADQLRSTLDTAWRARLRHPQLGDPIAVYRYERASGEPAFVVCRFDPKEFRVAQSRGGRWVWNLEGAPALAYRLPELEQAIAAGETIWVVDGEKDADALAAAGAAATCCARAQGWSVELAEQLTGARRIRIVADRDGGTGERQAREILELLVQAGAIASSDVELVQAAEGKDAADHLAAGRNLDAFEPLPATSAEAGATRVRVVSLAEFAEAEENIAAPLIGDEEKRLLPAGSTLVFYGEGGSAKSTLAIDMACALATGTEWLGFSIGRASTVLLLENEGPRAEFRLKLRRKRAGWQGPALDGRMLVLEEPWGRIDLRRDQDVGELAAALSAAEVDVLIAGPIRRLGLDGGGTPAETVAFMALVDRVRAEAGRPIAIVLVHHENKGGDISGAFEAEFDTVVHVKADGRNRTQLVFRKSRWSSRIHRSRATLAWIPDREGFTVIETDVDADRSAAAREQEERTALDWITDYIDTHYRDTGEGVTAGKVETAYHEAHGGHGRNLARRIIKAQIALAADLADGPPDARTGETSPRLATVPGDTRHGKYLIPFSHALSPLAAPPTGDTGETPCGPAIEASSRRLAAALREGGESGETRAGRRDGEHADDHDIDLDWR